MKVAVVVPNYNSAVLVQRCVAALLAQDPGPGHHLDVVVVDDGSTDGSADALATRFGDAMALVRLPENRGRSTARNAGATASDADVVVFVDSDCVPPDDQFIRAHLAAFIDGADVSFGAIETPGDGFWDRLQRDAAVWRKRRFESGDQWTYTTQNVAVRRVHFDRAGGFDPLFNRHGFEDRDLFVRLAQAGAKVCFSADARVVHADRITLASVTHKQGEAGFHAAHLFRERHPAVYGAMSYSRLDVDVRPWLGWLDVISWPMANLLARAPEAWLEWRWLPFQLRALMARAVYGLGYLHGTVRHRVEAGR